VVVALVVLVLVGGFAGYGGVGHVCFDIELVTSNLILLLLYY
jgi:hypothetical protein